MKWPLFAAGPHSNATAKVASRRGRRTLGDVPADERIQIAAGNLRELIRHERLLFDLADAINDGLREGTCRR
jgi:hypothetical protein